MFGLILITAATLLQIYVTWRAASAPFLRRHKKEVMIAGTVLWSLLLIGRLWGHASDGTLATFLDLFALTWMAVLFLLTVPLIAVDIATGFGFFLPRLVPSLRGTALICGLALTLISFVQGTRAPVVRNYEVELAGLPTKLDGTVMIGLSDLHIGEAHDGKWLAERVNQVRAERPDIIFLLGDIFEGHSLPAQEHIAVLRDLQAPMGVWAVLGNHEFHGNDDAIVPLFSEAGITVLRNEKASPRPGLTLAGVDDLTAHRSSGLNADLVRMTLATPSRDATILLSHTPWNADLAAKSGASLMLCGHTHGGQIWPFGYLVMQVYPLLAGRYDVDGMTVIVSRGAGTWGPRMRLWEPGEILRVTLRAKKKEV